MEAQDMFGKIYKNRLLPLLFAASIVFQPIGPLPQLSNSERPNELQVVRIVNTVLLPEGAIAASRVQQAWASALSKQNTHHYVAGTFCAPPSLQLGRCGNEADQTYWPQARRNRPNSNRAPPQSENR